MRYSGAGSVDDERQFLETLEADAKKHLKKAAKPIKSPRVFGLYYLAQTIDIILSKADAGRTPTPFDGGSKEAQ